MTPRRRVLFNGKKFSSEALAWRTDILSKEGGKISDEKLLILDEFFFKPSKKNGNILTELDRFNLWGGLGGFEIAARTNLIKSAHYATPVSSPILDNNGTRSGGTGYWDLNYIESSGAVKLTQNSASIGCVVKNPSYAALTRIMGAVGSTGRATYLGRQTTPSLFAGINTLDGAVSNTNTVTVGTVFFEAIRNNNTQTNPLINGVGSIGSQASNAILPNVSMFELTNNNNGTPQGSYDTSYHLCSWAGSGNLDVAALKTILNNLFTKLEI